MLMSAQLAGLVARNVSPTSAELRSDEPERYSGRLESAIGGEGPSLVTKPRAQHMQSRKGEQERENDRADDVRQREG